MKRYVLGFALVLFASSALEAGTVCHITFSMSGWSVFYKTASGSGTITCDNGQSAKVRLTSKGGGLTFGKSKIKNAKGRFTEVDSIGELFGSYAQAEAHAGAGASSGASVMTKGEVSLSIAGTGTGVDLGVSFGKLTIERR